MKIARYFLVGVLFYCCSSKNSTRQTFIDTSVIKEVIFDASNKISVDSVIADCKFIKLDSTKNLIGEIWQTIVTDQNLIIVDKLNSSSVFIFDKTGKSEAVIHRLGRGPHEYLSISHVALTPDQQTIAIIDSKSSKVLFFDLAGNFLERKKIPSVCLDMEYITPDEVVCTTIGRKPEERNIMKSELSQNQILFTDNDFNIKSAAFPNRYNADFLESSPSLKKFGTDVEINTSYCDTIYRVSSGGQLTAKYHLDMSAIGGISNLPADITNEKLKKLSETNCMFYGSYANGKDFAIFNISTPPQNIIAPYLYSKASGKTYRLTLPARDDDDFYSKIYLNGSCTCYDNQFIAAIPSYRILQGTSPQWQKKHPEIMDGLTEDSNPILVFYTLREP